MGILFWKKKSDKEAFRQRYIEKVLERFPDLSHELDGEYGVKWSGLPRHETVTTWMESGYKEFVDSPKDGEAILDKWVKLLEGMILGESKPLNLEYLVPMIRHESWLKEQQSHLLESVDPTRVWSERYNEELVVFYVSKDSSIHFVHMSEVIETQKPLAEVRAIAMANLVRLTAGRSVTGENGRYLVSADSSLDATLILNPEIFKDARIRVQGDWVVGVPDRNSLLVCDSNEPFQVFQTAFATRRLFRTESYSISSKLFLRSIDRFVLLDPKEDDDEHPIPKLDVLDIHARKNGGGGTLCIIIATPIQADARSIYRLAVKLDAYLTYIESAEYEKEFGKAQAADTTVEINIHPESSEEVFRIFDSISEWVARRGASLEIVKKDFQD